MRAGRKRNPFRGGGELSGERDHSGHETLLTGSGTWKARASVQVR